MEDTSLLALFAWSGGWLSWVHVTSTASPTDVALLWSLVKLTSPKCFTFFEVRDMLACWFCTNSTRSQSSKTFCYVRKKKKNKLISWHLSSWELILWQLGLVRVGLVAIDFMRIDLVKGSQRGLSWLTWVVLLVILTMWQDPATIYVFIGDSVAHST